MTESKEKLPSFTAPRWLSLSNVEHSLYRLNPKEREAYILRYVGEGSLKTIAAVIEVPVSTIKSRLSRARQKLKAGLLI